MEREFDLDTFKKVNKAMIEKSKASWDNSFGRSNSKRNKGTDSIDEIREIINSADEKKKSQLSYEYFVKDGFYKKLILYYATLLKYTGVLIPHPSYGKDLSENYIQKRYFSAVEYIDKINLKQLLTNFAVKTLVAGAYYGIIQKLDKNQLVILDLPEEYCSSRLRDLDGNDIIEFDVSYFNNIRDEELRKQMLSIFPKEVSSFYKKEKYGKVIIPSHLGVYFSILDSDSTPLLVSTIPATLEYDDSVEVERERDKEETRKVLVLRIPHLTSTGELVFQPSEALEMHNGAVGMMQNNKNVSVLTTYADVDVVSSKTSADTVSNNLEKMMQNIYYQAGVSSQIFSPTGNLTVETSIKNDISLIMILANKFSNFITKVVNKNFENSNITFEYKILPISYYNDSKYLEDSFKLAQSGYSFILPALAMDISQRDLGDLKDLENNVLNLAEKLKPLSSTFNQSEADKQKNGDNPVGAPKKSGEEKSPKTLQNEDSINKTGGSK